MRLVLTLGLGLAAASACSLYAPVVADCTITCGEGGACPEGFSCRGAFCRPAAGPAGDCACRPTTTRACGSAVGECAPGEQRCGGDGEWGPCLGGQGPVAEACDGKDNDCDGLVDLGPVQTLLADDTGPFEGYWRLHGHDGGYVMVTPLALPDGGAEVRALFFDRQLAPQGRSPPLVAGGWRRADSMAEGGAVYVAYAVGEGVELSRVTADGQVAVVGTVPDAGYDGRMQVGVGPEGVTTTWLSVEATARVAKWPRDGRAPTVRDLPRLPEGTLWWVDATTDGQYVMLEAELPDGGVVDAVHHVDEGAPRTLTAPYWKAARFITRRNGQVAHLDILDVSGALNVVFYRDFVTQATDGYMVVEAAGRWHDSDFVLDVDDSLVAAWVNEDTQRMVLARIEGTSVSDQQVTRFIPPDDVVVPISQTSGNVRVAKVPGDAMFGLAWSTRTEVFARRFCAPGPPR